MSTLKKLVAGAVLLSLSAVGLKANQLYSIYWMSNPKPCSGLVGHGMAGPVVSSRYPICSLAGIQLSICRSTVSSVDNDPWQAGAPITVVGYSLSILLDQAKANSAVVIGQAGGDGPDVFATAAGVGTVIVNGWLPAGEGIAIPNDTKRQGSNAHFDVYAGCDVGATFQVLISIYYTSP